MKLPFTLRLAYHGFRATVRAGLLLFIAWLIFIPANESEVTALGAKADSEYPAGLRAMRTARVVVAIAPQRWYDLIAAVMGPEVSPVLIQIAMNQMALGQVLPASTRDPTDTEFETSRDIDGPRFIKID